MKKNQIRMGGIYLAKVNNKLTEVRVEDIIERQPPGARSYRVTNLKTGRKTTFRSAQKFRSSVKPVKKERPAEVHSKSKVDQALAKSNQGGDVGAPHVVVEARAGTGKTTTLVEGLKILMGVSSKLVPSEQQEAVWHAMNEEKPSTVCFTAFNKSIATELQERVPEGCDAMTMHSMGYKAVREMFGRVQLNKYRVRDIISELTGIPSQELRKNRMALLKSTERLVSLAKMNMVDYTDPASLEELAAFYDVDLNGDRDQVFDLTTKVVERCKDVDRDRCIDFDDMIWIAVVLKLPVQQYDLLLVDEAQDLNRARQELAMMAGRRIVLCGDPRQAIYGFAGADTESMNRMEFRLKATGRGCVHLPLTVTRRCGRAIVEEARKIVSDFEYHEDNTEGTVLQDSLRVKEDNANRPPGDQSDYHSRAADGDMVLCRVNAPLISECFRFLRSGRKANIQGRDVGRGLISLVRKSKAQTIVQLVAWLGDWLDREQKKEQAKRNPSEARLIAIQDRHDCVLAFTEGVETTDQVVQKIESIFTDDRDNPGIKLSSVHKSKGLEANRVFILLPDNGGMPHPMAKSTWAVEQEHHLKYVAITRAIKELVWVS